MMVRFDGTRHAEILEQPGAKALEKSVKLALA